MDSERISSRVFAGLLAELGLYFTLDEMVETFIGNSMARCEEIVTERLGFAPPDDLVERYHALTREALAREVQPVDGIIKLLDDLDVAHIPYCVASNGEHEKMRTSLGATGLLARFEGRRFSADDVTRPKPAPDLFLHTAEAMGVRASDCVVVEDSPLGVRSARDAGMTVIGYADLISASRLKAAGANVVVAHLSLLGTLLGLSK